MKQLVLLLSAASLLVACNNQPDAAKIAAPVTNPLDTVGLAAYNAAKLGQLTNSELEEKKETEAPVAQAAPRVRTVTRYVTVPEKRRPVRSVRREEAPVASTPSAAPSSAPGSENTAGTGDQGSMSSGSDNTAQAEEKKGWSKAAKGAVIGGVAGAAGGAVINKKNRAAGAVIGGIIGAASGYGVGRGQDKKDGRY